MDRPATSPGSSELDRRISQSLLRLRIQAPFFAALSLFVRFRADPGVPTAETDGVDVLYNPGYLGGLPPRQLDAVLLHEVLHAALLHVTRRGLREAVRWNVAADVVVNGVLAQQSFLELPPGAVREPALENHRVEEVYERLRELPPLCASCLRPLPGGGELPSELRRLAEVEAYWRQALHQARAITSSLGQGKLPAGLERLLRQVAEPQLDWRTQLWRFLVRTPTDFSGFDRRFVHRGLYLETLEGESLRVHVCVDTSGSISASQLAAFLGELHGILGAYPHVEAQLYYADASLYGPYPLQRGDLPPRPVGGGGTSFVPFFERVLREASPHAEEVCVYLTDGYGTFPASAPGLPVLWVVTPGGLQEQSFPFGEVLRLLEHG